jgi:hypothetical protein
VNNVEENMSRILMTLSLIALIACNNQNSKDDLPEDKPDINKKEKTSLSQIDSLFESIPTLNIDEIYGDSICRSTVNYALDSTENVIFDKLTKVDSLKTLFGQGSRAKIIGKGKINKNFKKIYAVRYWGEWLCTVELMVFNNNWNLTGYDFIAGFGGGDGESDLGNCKLINDSIIKRTWISTVYYFKELATGEAFEDSTIIETEQLELHILSNGSIVKNNIKEKREKI